MGKTRMIVVMKAEFAQSYIAQARISRLWRPSFARSFTGRSLSHPEAVGAHGWTVGEPSHRLPYTRSMPEAKPVPGRNEPCHCGSGRKYKQCCLEKDEAARRKAQASGE